MDGERADGGGAGDGTELSTEHRAGCVGPTGQGQGPAGDDDAQPSPAPEHGAEKPPPSDKRVEAWMRLRAWETDLKKRQRDFHGSLKGPTVVKARKEGRMRPYYAGALQRAAGWWQGALPSRLIAMVGWVLAADKLGRPGVTIAHRHFGELEGVSKRTAGTWMRRAAKAGFVVLQANYVAHGDGHRQLANTYRPTAQLLALLARITHGAQRARVAAAGPPPTPEPYQGGNDFHPTKNSRYKRQQKEEKKVSAPSGAELLRSLWLRRESPAAILVRQLTGVRVDDDIAPEIASALIAFQRANNPSST